MFWEWQGCELLELLGNTALEKETRERMVLYQRQVNSEGLASPLKRGSNNPAGRRGGKLEH